LSLQLKQNQVIMNKKTILSFALLFVGIGLLSAQTRTPEPTGDVNKQAYYANGGQHATITAAQQTLKLENAQEGSSTWNIPGFTFTGDPVLDMAAYTAAKQDFKSRNQDYVPSRGTNTLGAYTNVTVTQADANDVHISR
jgi:hypothetical protein